MYSQPELDLFLKAAKDLPAYKRFLEAHRIDVTQIKSPSDLVNVPPINKKDYLKVNKMEDLVWPENQASSVLLCATSGSTGEPYYFPRDDKLSWQYSFLVEDFIKNSSYGSGRTLVLIGFGMGIWIGGILTLRAFEIAGERMSAPLAILPTGYNKQEIFKALHKLSPMHDQTIIVGYPPFIKEIVDDAKAEKINLKKLNIRFMFAAETFTETFREYVCRKAGVKNSLVDTLNVYGTADIGAMAYETPLSILIRKLALEIPELYQQLFGQIEKTPTVAQYNPKFITFEATDNEVILTADGALPLIRYAVGDHGGVFEYKDIQKTMFEYGIDLEEEIQKAKIHPLVNRQLPFVYVYERVDMSVTLHGINIYPEFIKESLLHADIVDSFTGKFTMSTKYDIHFNQFLQINLELQKDKRTTKMLEKLASKTIHASLITRSSEFSEVSKNRPTKNLLQIILWPNGHPRYFPPSTKQKWVEKH